MMTSWTTAGMRTTAVVVAAQVMMMDLVVKLQDLLALAAVAVVGVRQAALPVLVDQVLF